MVCSRQADEKLFSHWEEVRAQQILKQADAFQAGLPGIQRTVIRGPAKSKLAIAHSHRPVHETAVKFPPARKS